MSIACVAGTSYFQVEEVGGGSSFHRNDVDKSRKMISLEHDGVNRGGKVVFAVLAERLGRKT